MLGCISRGIGHKSGGKRGTKYRFDITFEKLDNLPGPVKKCRVVWSRGAKLQMTSIKDVNKGAVLFKEQLSQIATMYQDAKGAFEPKEYKFQVQVPGKEDNKLLTVGRADLDMAHYALTEGTAQSKMIPILFKVGMASTGYLKVSITAHMVASGTDSDDGMTEVSGMTGMTASLGDEQDLTGFDEDRAAQPSSGGRSGANSRPSSRLSTAATSPSKPDSKAAAATAADKASTSSTGASKSKAALKAAAKGGDDDEISPLSLSPASSGGSSPRTSSSLQPVRSAGKPSVVDKDARAQLFGTAPSKPSKPAPSNSSTSSKLSEAPLSEEEARAALLGGATVAKRPSAPAAAASSSSSKSSKPAAAPDYGKATSASKAAAATSIPPAASTRSPSVVASDGGAGPSSTPVVRRGLLDHLHCQEKQQAQAASPSSDTTTSSSRRPQATPKQHSLSDSDDDSMTEQPKAAVNTKQQPAQTKTAPNPASSRQKQQPVQQPQAQQAAADASSVQSKASAAEVEKLKAQVVALRQQAGEAEESRRMAVLAADNAASERDEYRSQVQELQEQLKEALVSLMTPEEAASLREELQALQQLLTTQQAQHADQQRAHDAAEQAWQEERKQLQQQVQDAQHAQQDVAQQKQQLQADADSQAGLMRHLSWQLEAAQQAIAQQQDQGKEQEQGQLLTQGPSGVDEGGSSPSALIADLSAAQAQASSAERKCAQVLQFLADEAAALTPQGLVTHCMSDQLLEGVSGTIATLELDGCVQGPVMEVLGTLRAAAAALQHMEAEQASLNTRLAASAAALAEAQMASDNLQQQCSSQVSRAAAALQDLQAEVAHLQQENMQLVKMQAAASASLKLGVQPGKHEQPGSPRIVAAMKPTVLGGTTICTEAGCKACGSLRQQLFAAQQKATRLTAARDKLELVLHDLEAASAEEQQQLEHQLAAANKALRATGQQLAAAQQDLTRTHAELLDTQQHRDATTQQLQLLQQQHEAALQQQEQGRSAAAAAAAQASTVGPQLDTASKDSAAQVIAMAESAGPSGIEQALAAAQDQVADLQRQLAEAETTRRGLEKQLGRARKQLADEQAERSTLEEHMTNRLEELGDDGAQETVAAYEAKYNRLKSRYRELTEVHREEVDKLHDEIASLQERVVELEAQTAQLEAARAQAQYGEVTLADTLAKAGKASSELAALRAENMELMQTLVHTKMELALCCEREVVGRHELYKSRETNLKLASKMTKLETLVYSNKK